MAGEPGHDPTFYIYPSTAFFKLSAVDSAGTVLGTFTSCDLIKTTRNNKSCYAINFISSNVVTVTVEAFGKTYSESSYFGSTGHEIDLYLPTQNLYAWTNPGSNLTDPDPHTIYTITDNPTTTTTLYNADGTVLALSNITGTVGPTIGNGDSISSADASSIVINAID